MLKSISVKDFAIISALELNLADGLNIFTGETGAGKSIVIEALGFVLGSRGDSGLIRQGAAKMSVSAVFGAEDLPQALKQKYKITGEIFTVKRDLDSKAKSRAWINGLNVLISELGELGGYLIDFHGQHEHQALFKSSAHLDLLDSFAGLEDDLKKMRVAYDETKDIEAKIAALEMSASEKERALDLYKYQLGEIEKLEIQTSEDAEIEAALPKLKNSGRLKEQSESSFDLLSGMEGSACELLSKAENMLNDMASSDMSLDPLSRELSSARTVIEDIAATLGNYKDDIDSDPAALDDMLSRQEALRKAKIKYGPSLEDVLNFAAGLKKKIEALETGEENTQKLKTALEISVKKLLSLSEGLHQKREKAALKLGTLVAKEISPLGFEQVRFEVSLEKGESIGPKGADSAEFLFSSNPGQALRPLRNIASGGEISRLMLGLKTVLAGGTPIMVFDEIDAGISGHTGKLVGEKLKKVSSGRQVLCVTHLAQVAVFGDNNFNVAKFVKNNNTEVKVCVLNGATKVQEIARMIGSSTTASAGYRHAEELLQEAETKVLN